MNSKLSEGMVHLTVALGVLTFLAIVFIMNQQHFHPCGLSSLVPKLSVISVLQI